MNKMFRKLNKFLNNFKVYKNKNNNKLKWFIIKLVQSLKCNNFYLLNKLLATYKNKNVLLKYKEESLLFIRHLKKKKLVKINFFIGLFYRLYNSYYLNYKSKNNVLLKNYFYFYNFIIKIFLKLFSSFKFIILNAHFKFNKNNLIRNFIQFKLILIFFYYKKILSCSIFKNSKLKKKKIINKILTLNVKSNSSFAKNKVLNLKFNNFIQNIPEWRRKFINEKLSFFIKKLNARAFFIKKLKRYKKGDYFFFLKLNKLKEIYNRLYFKLNRMKSFKKKNILNMYKLFRFINNNKLKKKKVFKFLKLGLKKKRKKKIVKIFKGVFKKFNFKKTTK